MNVFGKVPVCTSLLFLANGIRAQTPAGAPVYKINPAVSKITFFVKASISIDGTFDKWDASLTFTSADVSTGVLDVKIQAASVDTGSGFKDAGTRIRAHVPLATQSNPFELSMSH